jgi:hypothetical protein
MAFDRNAALQAGYSEEEIDAYLREEASKKKQAPAPAATSDTPPDSTTVVPEAGGGVAGAVTTGALAAAPYVGSAALGAGGLYGARVLKQGFDAMQSANAARAMQAEAAMAQAQAQNAATQGLQQRFDARMAQQAGQAVRPVAPGAAPTYNVPTSNMPQVARPVAPMGGAPAPVAPAAPAPAVAPQAAAGAGEASLIDKTTAMIRQLAANKVLGNMVKGGVGAGLAMYSPDLGPAVPSVGRLKGSEINPLTGAPWTKEQIQQYESNPNMFDAQLPAPQMRR